MVYRFVGGACHGFCHACQLCRKSDSVCKYCWFPVLWNDFRNFPCSVLSQTCEKRCGVLGGYLSRVGCARVLFLFLPGDRILVLQHHRLWGSCPVICSLSVIVK